MGARCTRRATRGSRRSRTDHASDVAAAGALAVAYALCQLSLCVAPPRAPVCVTQYAGLILRAAGRTRENSSCHTHTHTRTQRNTHIHTRTQPAWRRLCGGLFTPREDAQACVPHNAPPRLGGSGRSPSALSARARVLRHGLRALGHRVLRELTRQQQAHGCGRTARGLSVSAGALCGGGRARGAPVWISRDVSVCFLLYRASRIASAARRSNVSFTKLRAPK